MSTESLPETVPETVPETFTDFVPEYFKCSKCAFESKSKKGLNIHIKRKHSKCKKEKFPQTCDLCKKEINNSKELKKKMKSNFIQAHFPQFFKEVTNSVKFVSLA